MGGRVEVFNRGINMENVCHYDVPGMYGHIMQGKLPYGNPVFIRELPAAVDSKAFFDKLAENNLYQNPCASC